MNNPTKPCNLTRFLRSHRALRPTLFLGAALLVTAPVFAQGQMGGQMGGGPMGGMNGQMGGMNRNGGGNQNQSQRAEQRLRMLMQSAGYTDTKLLDTIVAFVKEKDAARKPLYTAANALGQLLTSEEATQDQISKAWDNFQTALDTEKARAKTSEAALDAKINYSADKKLASALTLAGVIGDASGYLGSANGANRGGPPGGMNGQMGGMNGQMGGMNGQMGGMNGQMGGMNGGPMGMGGMGMNGGMGGGPMGGGPMGPPPEDGMGGPPPPPDDQN